MSTAPVLRSAVQTIKTAQPAAAAAIDSTVVARSVVSSTGRSSTITASITQQTTARSLTTSASSASSQLVTKTATESLIKDAIRVVDQTASDGLEKLLELSENTLKRAEERAGGDQGATVEVNSFAVAQSSCTNVPMNSENIDGIADKIASEVSGAFDSLKDSEPSTTT